MTVYESNKQVSSMQAYIYTLIYIGYQGIVYLFVGHVSCIVWERCTFGEVSCMQVILSSVFLSWMERFLGMM